MSEQELEQLSINTIRLLSADAVEQAKSGHPGLPMGAAAFAYTLWMKHLSFNPKNPDWVNRDRFVLSAGHGSMLLYSLLHLTGYDLSLDEIKRFRQWDSLTPGHPENFLTPGVETTTGPLGQGFGNAVGMALAERFLANRYNKPGYEIIDYYTYVLASDGDMMEGVSSEAASFAGGLGLGKLICLYDSNQVSLDGPTELAFHEDTAKRFEAYGWQTITVDDGNDVKSVDQALKAARADERPSLLIINTTIGYGSPNKSGSSASHGAPLGDDELALTKKHLGWASPDRFYIPEPVLKHFRTSIEHGKQREEQWQQAFKAYQADFPELAGELNQRLSGKVPTDWDKNLPTFEPGDGPMASREASGAVINAISDNLPLFVGGSADLGTSNNTKIKASGDITTKNWQRDARNLHFGVREHGMGAILNGLALSKIIRPFGATFLVFSDYMRGAMRLAAIMKLPVTFVFTHDSIGQGEDGATHQPIEHLASLRAMPNLTVIRPADAMETVEAWKQAINNSDGPTALVLTRQKLPVIDRSKYEDAKAAQYGAYVIRDTDSPNVLLIASGSEVSLALEAAEKLEKQDIKARVVSIPSTEIFEQQDQSYKNKILPPHIKARLIIEAASPFGWEKYAGEAGDIMAINRFGASAPGPVVMEKYGFTVDNVINRVKKLLN